MRLSRSTTGLGRGAGSLVPLVDAMLILLIFFMVTSSFLDLDMLPLSATEDGSSAAPTPTETAATPVFIRLTSAPALSAPR